MAISSTTASGITLFSQKLLTIYIYFLSHPPHACTLCGEVAEAVRSLKTYQRQVPQNFAQHFGQRTEPAGCITQTKKMQLSPQITMFHIACKILAQTTSLLQCKMVLLCEKKTWSIILKLKEENGRTASTVICYKMAHFRIDSNKDSTNNLNQGTTTAHENSVLPKVLRHWSWQQMTQSAIRQLPDRNTCWNTWLSSELVTSKHLHVSLSLQHCLNHPVLQFQSSRHWATAPPPPPATLSIFHKSVVCSTCNRPDLASKFQEYFA